MKIAIGSDHAGFHYKLMVKDFLQKEGHILTDLGTNNEESCDYPDFAIAVGKSVSAKESERGILVCGTGIGMAIAANKISGIRAAVCWNEEIAQICREHNDCNVLCLGARIIEKEMLEKIVSKWLKTDFKGGRHQKRVEKINNL